MRRMVLKQQTVARGSKEAMLPKVVWILVGIIAVTVPEKQRELFVPEGIADFVAEVMVHVFNATRVEILVSSYSGGIPSLLTSTLHSTSVVTTTIRISSTKSGLDFINRVLHGLPTNTKFYIICLLSEEDYRMRIISSITKVWTHLIYSYWVVLGSGHNFTNIVLKQRPCTFYLITATTEGYVLLGPNDAKRSNCSGVRTIARWPKSSGSKSVMLVPPAKEQRSNVLALACAARDIGDKKEDYCSLALFKEGQRVIQQYLNITRMVAMVAPLPIVSDDIFPPEGTYSGLLTHGVADIRLSFIVMKEHRAFCTQFVTPLLVTYSFAYLYPSPRVLTSNFTVMKIFSVAVWCFWGASLAVIFFALRAVSVVERCSSHTICVSRVSSLAQSKAPVATCSMKRSRRILLLAIDILLFMITHCFTGAYISFLNKPIHEEAPDTEEKLLTALQKGSLAPCIVKNTFEDVMMRRSKSPSLSRLKSTVQDWAPFTGNSMSACIDSTRRRRTVYFADSAIAKNSLRLFPGQVEASDAYAPYITLPASILIPKASPYKDVLDKAAIRMLEAGVIDQFSDRYWYRVLPAPNSTTAEDVWQPLETKESLLPFVILGAGLCASLGVFISEMFCGIVKKRQHPRQLRVAYIGQS